MKRGVMRRSAVAGIAIASVTTIVCAASGGAAMANPSGGPSGSPQGLGSAATADRVAASKHGAGADRSTVVKNRYIVTLKDKKASATAIRAAAASLTKSTGGSVRQIFSRALHGYSAQMTPAQAKRLGANAAVASVVPVVTVKADGTQTTPPWGLDRIDQTTPVLNKSYTYPTTASDVTAYIIDSGIRIDHTDFGGRASYGGNFVLDATPENGNNTDPANANDCAGHGTHVAGTVGGTNSGVAKGVQLVAVRVLNCEGSGTTEQVVAGVDWVTANAAKPAVANMSLGGSCGPADPTNPDYVLCVQGLQLVDNAVAASIASGVTYAVSAGNDWDDACTQSPSRVPSAITVGATDNVDFRAWFSNVGPCVDLFAPGVGIVSDGITSTTATATMSGTSMASPHVTGAAALLLSANPTWTPQQVRDAIVTGGISGAVHDAEGTITGSTFSDSVTPNRLLHVGAPVVARSQVGLQAYANGNYVTAESAGTLPLIARSTAVGPWETYDVVSAGTGFVAFKAKANGKYVTAESAGAKPLIARSTAIGAWEKFQVVDNLDGSVSFKANANGKYVTAESGGAKPLIARGTTIGAWEKFAYAAPAPTISIKATANAKFVTAESAGAKPLIARGTTVGAWEKFTLVDVGGGLIGLKAQVNGKYVTAESAGTKPLIARSSSIGYWEAFYVLSYNSDGTIFLTALVNNLAVTAESAGAKPLIANRAFNDTPPNWGLGAWEKFTLAAV